LVVISKCDDRHDRLSYPMTEDDSLLKWLKLKLRRNQSQLLPDFFSWFGQTVIFPLKLCSKQGRRISDYMIDIEGKIESRSMRGWNDIWMINNLVVWKKVEGVSQMTFWTQVDDWNIDDKEWNISSLVTK
jgi:hypothetical protein